MTSRSDAELEAQRESIAQYLEHVSTVQVGSILTDSGRETVRYCASWVRNRLDEKWAAAKRGQP